QIWLGKWLGILSLNAVLLALCGASVYALLLWRATRLPPEQQKMLRNEVLVARGSVKEAKPNKEIDETAEKVLRERLEKNPINPAELPEVRKQLREQVKATYQVVAPGYYRPWTIDLGLARHSLRDQPLYLRIKFNAAEKSPSGTFDG